MFYSAILRVSVTYELVHRLTNCFVKLQSAAASVQLLDKALFQATVGSGGNLRYAPGVRGAPSARPSSHSSSPSPAGRLTGERNSKQVEEAVPEGPLPCYNPSKWNQSGTMHPTVASKRSLYLSLSWVHRGVPL